MDEVKMAYQERLRRATKKMVVAMKLIGNGCNFMELQAYWRLVDKDGVEPEEAMRRVSQ